MGILGIFVGGAMGFLSASGVGGLIYDGPGEETAVVKAGMERHSKSSSRETIADAVFFLSSIGIVSIKGEALSPGTKHLHLSPESEELGRHHLNWRLRAIDSIGQKHPKDLYTARAIGPTSYQHKFTCTY